MASNKSEINVAELDFDLIKQELIDYFKSDPTFQDYEFEGSAINILMDILAYNTHMNAVIANMSANEMFIDSAQLRSSVVSIAKSIGYTPRSKRTARADIDLYFPAVTGSPLFLTMPAGTRFITAENIIFSTKEQHLIYPKPDGLVSEYLIEDVDIYEGVYNTFSYTFDVNAEQRFIIPSNDADISSLTVSVTSNNEVTEYARNENISTVTPDSLTYFLHERADGRYEVKFGDNIIGKQPINNSTINLSYIISLKGEEANNSKIFKKQQLIDNNNNYTITTKTVAYGAADRESIESIKQKAPNMYTSQSRAVTTTDYENFLLKEYPWIDSMRVWGGEYNSPPIYGKVFIALKPKHTDFLSETLKDSIKNDLIKKYNVVTVMPEIMSPDYLYAVVVSNVTYDVSKTSLKANELVVLVNQSIATYFNENTRLFSKPLYYSKLSTAIDNTSVAIVNSNTSFQLMKKTFPVLGLYETKEIKFSNAIVPGSLFSSYYNITGTEGARVKQVILDNSEGVLFTRSVLTNEIIHSNIGSIDYTTGDVYYSMTVYDLPQDTLDLRFYCTAVNNDIIPGYNQIILLDETPLAINYRRLQGVTVNMYAQNKDIK